MEKTEIKTVAAEYQAAAQPKIVTFDPTAWTGPQVPSLPVRVYNAVKNTLSR